MFKQDVPNVYGYWPLSDRSIVYLLDFFHILHNDLVVLYFTQN